MFVFIRLCGGGFHCSLLQPELRLHRKMWKMETLWPRTEDVSILRLMDDNCGLRQSSESVGGEKGQVLDKTGATYADPASVRTIPHSKYSHELGQEL